MNIYVLIGLMALATYSARVFPAILIKHVKMGKRFTHFLKLVPYTAMGTLVFPGILSVDSSQPWIGLVGGIVAVGLSLKGVKIAWVILGAILVTMIWYLF